MPAAPAPRVAVVIPCFGDGSTVGDAVRSAAEGGEPAEIVVVDDGSTDALTLRVLMLLRADGVSVLTQPNRGVAAARMAGVRATRAPLVLALDADDILVPGALRWLAEALDAHPRAAASWGSYARFGEETTLQQTATVLDPWQIGYLNDLPATALMRREALLQVGGWQEVSGYEDWDLWMALAEQGWEGVGLRRVVYRYRRAGGRRSERDARRHADIHTELMARHPSLVAARRRHWRGSGAPLVLRLLVPVIYALPLGPQRRRLLAGVLAHVAYGRGLGVLARRLRQQAAA